MLEGSRLLIKAVIALSNLGQQDFIKEKVDKHKWIQAYALEEKTLRHHLGCYLAAVVHKALEQSLGKRLYLWQLWNVTLHECLG